MTLAVINFHVVQLNSKLGERSYKESESFVPPAKLQINCSAKTQNTPYIFPVGIVFFHHK